MAAKMTKWTPLRALALAGLTLAAVVTACDTEAPTAIDNALLDVLANPEAAANADGSGNPVAEAMQIRGTLADGPQPLIFIDGVEVTNVDMTPNSDASGSTLSSLDPYSPLSSLNPDDIERIEVIKGAAAADLFGDRAEGGVIQIFTKKSDSSSSSPGPLSDARNNGPDDARLRVTMAERGVGMRLTLEDNRESVGVAEIDMGPKTKPATLHFGIGLIRAWHFSIVVDGETRAAEVGSSAT